MNAERLPMLQLHEDAVADPFWLRGFETDIPERTEAAEPTDASPQPSLDTILPGQLGRGGMVRVCRAGARHMMVSTAEEKPTPDETPQEEAKDEVPESAAVEKPRRRHAAWLLSVLSRGS